MTVIVNSKNREGWADEVATNLTKGHQVDLENFSHALHFPQCIELAAKYGVDFSITPTGSVGQFRKKGTAFLSKSEI